MKGRRVADRRGPQHPTAVVVGEGEQDMPPNRKFPAVTPRDPTGKLNGAALLTLDRLCRTSYGKEMALRRQQVELKVRGFLSELQAEANIVNTSNTIEPL